MLIWTVLYVWFKGFDAHAGNSSMEGRPKGLSCTTHKSTVIRFVAVVSSSSPSLLKTITNNLVVWTSQSMIWFKMISDHNYKLLSGILSSAVFITINRITATSLIAITIGSIYNGVRLIFHNIWETNKNRAVQWVCYVCWVTTCHLLLWSHQ